MQINSISNANFGAKWSPEMESKLISLGKHLLRDEKYDEYAELYQHAQRIKEMFPDNQIVLKPGTRLETIYDIHDKPAFKMPSTRYGLYLERFGENDISLGKDVIFNPQFRLTLEQVAEISRRLERASNKINAQNAHDKEIEERVINELI